MSIVNVTDIESIVEDFADPYVVTRQGAVNYDTVPGQPTAAASTTVNITACVQAPSGRDLMRMPEGLREEQTRIVYTGTALQLLPSPDTIAIEGADWQLETVEPFGAGAYFKCVVRRLQEAV